MSNNNFDYSIELISKMSELLKPDFMSVIEKNVKHSGYKVPKGYEKKKAIEEVSGLMEKYGSVTSRHTCGSYDWLFVFNCHEHNIIMTVGEVNSGTSFRYRVNDFEEKYFNNTIDYIAITMMEDAKREHEREQEKNQ